MYNNFTNVGTDINKSMSNMSINNTKNKNHKQLLDIYYYIDLDSTQDIEYIRNCLGLHIRVNQKQFQICKFQEFCNIQMVNESDVVKRGLLVFNKMFKQLKLKGHNEIWFIYISKGNVKELYENVFVTLVNKNPCVKTCLYAINKNHITVGKADDKLVKLDNIKQINGTLSELFSSENTITYTNLFD